MNHDLFINHLNSMAITHYELIYYEHNITELLCFEVKLTESGH